VYDHTYSAVSAYLGMNMLNHSMIIERVDTIPQEWLDAQNPIYSRRSETLQVSSSPPRANLIYLGNSRGYPSPSGYKPGDVIPTDTYRIRMSGIILQPKPGTRGRSHVHMYGEGFMFDIQGHIMQLSDATQRMRSRRRNRRSFLIGHRRYLWLGVNRDGTVRAHLSFEGVEADGPVTNLDPTTEVEVPHPARAG
jgi:hypothetical protein